MRDRPPFRLVSSARLIPRSALNALGAFAVQPLGGLPTRRGRNRRRRGAWIRRLV